MATDAPSPHDSRLRDALIRYYDDTWLDYRLVWLTPGNFAIHFGYHDHATRAGFSQFELRDITRHTRPSLRRLYAATFLGEPIDRALCRLGLRNEVQHGNVVGSRRQYEALRSRCWLYSAISATRA